MTTPVKTSGVWGYHTLRSKKAVFVCITKDHASGNTYKPDHEYIHHLLTNATAGVTGEKYKLNCISEGLYSMPKSVDIESVLDAEGFEKNESHAKGILDYHKEGGRLKSYL